MIANQKYSSLYVKDTYIIPEAYIINGIYEYDISKANINILYERGVINDYTYDMLYNTDKKSREIQVGIMQKDSRVAKELSDGFKYFRQQLFENNCIKDDEIVSIKKDAVFVTRPLVNTKFGRVEFKLKNTYGIMIKVNRLEIYYGLDTLNREHILDIKGINDEKLEKYDNYFFNILISIFTLLMNHSYVDALGLIEQYIKAYVNLQLDFTTYREFNVEYMYRMKNSFYTVETILPQYLGCVDISYNLNILLYIKTIIISMYYN